MAHLLFGANHQLPALWLTVLLALALGVALLFTNVRVGMRDVGPLWPLLVLFGLTLAVAGWTLSPLAPGGAHPIWAWADMASASTVNRTATLIEAIKLAGLACVFVLGCLHAVRSSWARATVDIVLVLGAVYSAVSILMFLSGAQIMRGDRLSGGFMSANTGATVLGMLTVLGLANLLRRWRQCRESDVVGQLAAVAVPLARLLLPVSCLFLTASRMGVTATIVAAGVFLIWDMLESKGKRLPIFIAGGVVLLVGLVLLAGGNDLLWVRLTGLEGATVVRNEILTAHWKAFLSSPLFGWGLGTFNDINSQIITPENYKALWDIRATHNVYIQWLEEAGIVGAAPMFLLIGAILVGATYRSYRTKTGQTASRGLVCLSMVVLLHGTSDYALQTPSVAAFWAFLLGLSFSFGRT